MATDNQTPAASLRQKAEELLKASALKENLLPCTETEILKLVFEMEVHQIELEMQNEELLKAKTLALDATLQYTELYDFAPSGYFTLSGEGDILDLNISGAHMLGKERPYLRFSKFAFFIAEDSKPVFKLFLDTVLNNKTKESCELTLSVNANRPTYVLLTGISTESSPYCQISMVDITENKLAQENLSQSEQRYKSLFRNSHSIMLIVDPDSGAIMDANDAACQYYGWPHDIICQKNISDINLLPTEEMRAEMHLAKKEKRNHFFFKHRLASGEVRDVEVFSSPIQLGYSKLLFSLIHDITDRRIAEVALRESELRYRSLANSGQALIWTTTPDKKCNYFNQVWLDFTGRTLGQELGDGWTEGVHPDDIDSCFEIFSSSFDKREAFSMDYRIQHRDGGYRWLQDNGTPQYDSKGNFTGFIGHCLDITEHKSTEAALLESEQQFKGAFQYSAIGMALVSPEGLFLKVNTRLCTMLGYSESELLLMSFQKITHPDDLQADLDFIGRLMAGEIDTYRMEKRYFHKSGAILWAQLSVSIVKDKSGKVIYFISQIEDISERKVAEIKARLTNETLVFLARHSSSEPGKGFFQSLSQYLAGSLEAEYVCISSLHDDGLQANTLAIWQDGGLANNQVFVLKNTPDGATVGKNTCVFTENITGSFPTDKRLQDLKATSYAGVTLWSYSGQPIGLISVLKQDRIINPLQTEDLLTLVAIRASGELERLKADQAIKQQVMLTQNVLDTTPGFLMLKDTNGIYLMVNQSFCDFLGKPKAWIIGKTDYELYPADEAKAFIESDTLVMQTGRAEHRDWPVQGGADKRWLHVIKTAVKDTTMKNIGVLCSVADITNRKLAEDTLRESEDRYKAISEYSSNAICIIDEKGKIEWANSQMTTISGFTTQQFLESVSFVSFIAPESMAFVVSNFQLMLAGENYEHHYVFTFMHANGEKRLGEKYMMHFVDKHGNKKLIINITDITGASRAADALRESEAKYRNIFLNAQEGVFQTRPDGSYISVNPAMAKMYGFDSPEELLRSRSDVSQEAYADPHERKNFIRIMEEQGFIKGYEYEVKRKDGQKIWFYEDAKAVKDENGRIQYFEGFVVDITERKQAEDALKNNSALLTNLIINLEEGILLENANREIALTNQLFCNMFGIPAPPEALVGADCSNSAEESKMFFKNPAKFIADIEVILADKKAVINHELELVDGRFFERDYIPTFLDNKYTGHLWKYRDITQRRQAALKLEKSEERFRQVVEQSQEVVWEVNAEGLYTYVSPLSLDIYGYTPEQMVGKLYFYDLHPVEGRNQFRDAALAIFSRKEIFGNLVNAVTRPDGNERTVLTNGIPILDANGTLTGYRGIDADITIRVKAETALKKSEEAYRFITERSNDLIFVCRFRPDLEFEYVSPSAEKMTGYAPGEFISDPYLGMKVVHPDDKHLLKSYIKQTLTQGSIDPGAISLRWIRKDGAIIWTETYNIPIYNEKGEITGLQGKTTEVTERKQAELIQNVRVRLADFAHTHSRNELQQKLLDELELLTGSCIGFFHVMNADQTSLTLQSWSTNTQEHLCKAEGQGQHYDIDKAGVWVDCVKQRKAVIHNDYMNLLGRRGLPEGHAPVIRELAVPVFRNDLIVAIVGIGNKKSDYNERDIETVSLLSDLAWDITERKGAEEGLKKLSQAVEQSPAIIYITSLSGTIEYANAKALDITGYAKEELMGKNPRIFSSREKTKEEYIGLWKTISSGAEWKGEFHNKKKNGEYYWVMASISPVFDAGGKILHYLAVEEDITNRKTADEKIRQQNEQLNAIVDAIPDLIFVIDKEGTYTEFSDAVPESAQINKDQSTDIHVKSLFDDISLDVHLKHIKQCIDEKRLVTYEYSTTAAHTPTQYEVRLAPLGTDKVLTFVRDITERKQVEKELYELNVNLEQKITERTGQLAITNKNLQTENEERLKAMAALGEALDRLHKIADRIPGVVYQFRLRPDGTTCFPFASQGIYDIYQVRPEELIDDGAIIHTRIHPEDLEGVENSIIKSARDLTLWQHEYRIRHDDGSIHWVLVNSMPEAEADGSVLWHGFISDISERKRAELFEDELLQLSLYLTGIPGTEISSALDMSLSKIGSFLDADRAYIFELNLDENTMSNTHEWCNSGIEPEIGSLQDIPYDKFPKWMESLQWHENIIIPSIHALPESWRAEREMLEPRGIQSLLVIPILNEKNLIGFVRLDAVTKEKDYLASEINILKVWSNMLSGLINNQRIEKFLDQTRHNYETFFNTIDDFLFVLNEKGDIIHTNNTVIQRLGYATDELLDQSVLMVHPAERRDEAGRIVGEMLAGTADFCPVPLITKSGNPIPVETRVKPGFWDSKPVIFGVSKDVTKIQLSEEKFSKAFQSNSALMAISRFPENVFIDVNDTFLTSLGYTRDELTGKTSADLDLYADPEIRTTIFEKLKNNIPVREIETRIRKKSGAIMIGLLSADYIKIGNDLCILSVVVDITLRKQAEEEVRKARTEADKANLAKSEFLSRMSHELRTPMNSILGFAQLMGMGELIPAHRKGVNHILNSGKHLLNLINEVLDISRIEAGRISLSIEPVQLYGTIMEMLDIVRQNALKRKLTLQLADSPVNRFYVKADSQRIKQVLLNLFNNAVKYNHEGGSVIIKTELRQTDSLAVSWVRVSISDTGVGISSDDLQKLFLPFERIGAERTEIEGTGLGLTVVKKLMDAMGGNLGVESVPGEGSTFWIELPQIESPMHKVVPKDHAHTTEAGVLDKTATLLYIEDNASNVELVEQILAYHRPGIRLLANKYGLQAVSLAKDFKPDLILLDLNLPDIHGREVFGLLQGDEQTVDIPVVIISADAMPHQLQKLLKAGAKSYLTKPLDVVDFLKIVDEFIAG